MHTPSRLLFDKQHNPERGNQFLLLKIRIRFNLNADVKFMTAHGANAGNKQLVKYRADDNKRRKHRLKSCRRVRGRAVCAERFVPQNEHAAESLQGTEI